MNTAPRTYWRGMSTMDLRLALAEYAWKAPDDLADAIAELRDEITWREANHCHRCDKEKALCRAIGGCEEPAVDVRLITCHEPACHARFVFVSARGDRAPLCLDHADERFGRRDAR